MRQNTIEVYVKLMQLRCENCQEYRRTEWHRLDCILICLNNAIDDSNILEKKTGEKLPEI